MVAVAWTKGGADRWAAEYNGMRLAVSREVMTRSWTVEPAFITIPGVRKPRRQSSTVLATPSVFKDGVWHTLATVFSVAAAKRAAERFAATGEGKVERTYDPASDS
jgi:hypothetical protein